MNVCQHEHNYTRTDPANERKTLYVVLLTTGMMGLEIAAGTLFGSMALLADGWHMGTHAAALGIALFAYRYARLHAHDGRYSFGVGKISILGGFTSAVVLQIVALLMMLEAVKRLFAPLPIRFEEAISVAVIGLVINLLSMRLLGQKQIYDVDHEDHTHAEDHNLKAAYMHVLADALTSILAIIALVAGSVFGWLWLDALMGIVGGLVISRWAIGLLRDTGRILLDGEADPKLASQIRAILESDANTRLVDLHIWRVGAHDTAAIIALSSSNPQPVEYYRNLVKSVSALNHLTIEVSKYVDQQ